MSSGSSLGLEPITLGKKIKLEYIPFSELVIPWEVCVDPHRESELGESNSGQLGVFTSGIMTPESSKEQEVAKQEDLAPLKASIGRFGLLKPFEVSELPEELDVFFRKGKYVIMDGQRRYFAIRELLRLPREHDENTQKDSLRTHGGHDRIERAERQAQQQFAKLSIRDYVLIPCLVYPYKTSLQMVRHSIEDSRLSAKPSRAYTDIVKKMRQQGIADLTPDDLSSLWETRKKIEEERKAIQKTLREIRSKRKS
ncbi:MAG: hypothetical protein JSV64_03610 [Candidatus Bathyarchaeota archaeon]|nr:MAG: hypothetical protein JSV64_03610 [Candidatus Bathyarchaeota archaeon]